MPDLTVTCQRCNKEIAHICDTTVVEAATKLLNYTPGFFPESVSMKKLKEMGYEKGDEDAPFFSEGYLYNLMGKEEARTIRALLYQLIMAVGLQPDTLWKREDNG